LVFSKVKTGRACNIPHTAPLIIPDQKVTAGALNEVVKSFRMLLGLEGRCVLAGAPTLKSVEIRVCEGLERKKCSTLGTALSPLFIEVESCRAVVTAHQALAVTKSWEV